MNIDIIIPIAATLFGILVLGFLITAFNEKNNAGLSNPTLFEKVYENKDVFYLTCVVRGFKVWGFTFEEKLWVCSVKDKADGEVKYFLSQNDVPHRCKDNKLAVSICEDVCSQIMEKYKSQKVVSFKQVEIV